MTLAVICQEAIKLQSRYGTTKEQTLQSNQETRPLIFKNHRIKRDDKERQDEMKEKHEMPPLHSGPSSIDRVANQKLLFAIILAIFTRLAATLTHYGHN